MSSTVERRFYVDELEGKLPVARLVSADYWGFSRFNATLLPSNGRFGRAHFTGRVALSQEPIRAETEISSNEARITGSVTCESLNPESWFEMRTERYDRTGYHTRDRSDVPNWVSEEGDEGYIRVDLSFDPDLTVEETSFSYEDLDRKRTQYRDEYFE